MQCEQEGKQSSSSFQRVSLSVSSFSGCMRLYHRSSSACIAVGSPSRGDCHLILLCRTLSRNKEPLTVRLMTNLTSNAQLMFPQPVIGFVHSSNGLIFSSSISNRCLQGRANRIEVFLKLKQTLEGRSNSSSHTAAETYLGLFIEFEHIVAP